MHRAWAAWGKTCNAKWRRQGERPKKKPQQFSTLFSTFLCHSCHNVKLLCNTFYGENVVCPHKKFCLHCCLCSCSLLFYTAAHFYLAGYYHFSFSHRRYKIFMLFFQQNSFPLFFISRSFSQSLSFSSLSPTFLVFSIFLFVYIPNLWK